MYPKINKSLINILLVAFVLSEPNTLTAGNFETKQVKFEPNFSSTEENRRCTDSVPSKTFEGMRFNRYPCWQYSYNKTVNYPSKNDCDQFKDCYEVGTGECLQYDSLKNCVNRKMEFSCERPEEVEVDKEKVKPSLNDRNQVAKLVCKGLPCLDGDCVDKEYPKNNEMMDTVAKLKAFSSAKNLGMMQFRIFDGSQRQCLIKPASYLNCCDIRGWGKNIFKAGCSDDDRLLIEQRKRNLCVYVGQVKSGTKPFQTKKNRFCCFPTILEKNLQVQGRAQLGMSFGSAESPNCRGLTMEELMRIDFDKIDFSEVHAEILKNLKLPQITDIDSRIKQSMPKMNSYDPKAFEENNRSGINEGSIKELGEEQPYE